MAYQSVQHSAHLMENLSEQKSTEPQLGLMAESSVRPTSEIQTASE
jgi:hypothetical protein